MACVPSKETDQPGHLPSLIRVFAVRMKKSGVLSYPLSAQQRLWSDWAKTDQTGRMPRLIWVFAGRTVILLVLSWGGSDCCNYPKSLLIGFCLTAMCPRNADGIANSVYCSGAIRIYTVCPDVCVKKNRVAMVYGIHQVRSESLLSAWRNNGPLTK